MQGKFWEQGQSIPEKLPLYYRSVDEPHVRNALKSNGQPNFPLVVEIKPNGETLLGLIHAYLIAESRNDYAWLTQIELGAYEYPTRSILMICGEISRGLKECSSEKVSSACFEYTQLMASMPESQKKMIPAKLHLAVDYISELTHNCICSLEHGSPFKHSNYLPKHRAWWSGSAYLLKQSTSMRLSIPTKFGLPHIPLGFRNIEQWLLKMESRFSQLVEGTKSTKENAIFEASAYCSAMAERYFLRGNCALAILFLHRSADLLMMKVCYSRIDFTKGNGGGKYQTAYAPPNGDDIHLRSSIIVADNGLLLYRQARNDAFNELNDWRNLLIHTHYMSDMEDSTVSRIFRTVRSYLEDIGGAEWKIARDTYLEGIPLKIHELLNIDGALSNMFTVVDINTWN